MLPWTSQFALKALRGGSPQDIVDGYIFYLNPLRHFASNELWDELVDRKEPIIAMRTVSGGNVHRLRDVPGAAWKEYLQKRAIEVAPIFERSGIKSWTEFGVRFVHSLPQVRATVGSTSQPQRLKEFLHAAKIFSPCQMILSKRSLHSNIAGLMKLMFKQNRGRCRIQRDRIHI